MRKFLLVLGASAVLAATAGAQASETAGTCGAAPKEQWMTTEAAKARGVEQGYEVRRVKVEKGCYELYAVDKQGRRAELYMNPVSGEIVQSKADD